MVLLMLVRTMVMINTIDLTILAEKIIYIVEFHIKPVFYIVIDAFF